MLVVVLVALRVPDGLWSPVAAPAWGCATWCGASSS